MKTINRKKSIRALVLGIFSVGSLNAQTFSYTAQNAGSDPEFNTAPFSGAVFESGDVNARSEARNLGFHGFGGAANQFAYGFTTDSLAVSGSASLIDTRESYSLAVGDTLQIETLVGGLNVGGGSNQNALNQILQIGLTSASSGSAFTADSFFLSGYESSSSIASEVTFELGFRNESGLAGASIGQVSQTHTNVGFSNNFFIAGLSFTRNADNSITYGVALDEIDAFTSSSGFGDVSERFTSIGTISAADHGLSSFNDLNVAFGYDIVDRSMIAISGVSYDFDDSITTRFAAVPEPMTFGLLSLSTITFMLRRRR